MSIESKSIPTKERKQSESVFALENGNDRKTLMEKIKCLELELSTCRENSARLSTERDELKASNKSLLERVRFITKQLDTVKILNT